MHEFAIAQRIIKIIEEEAKKNNISRVKLAKLRIGKMEAFQKEQLEIYLSTYEKNEILEGMKFEIEEVDVQLKCRACSKEFSDKRFDSEEYAHQIAHAPVLFIPPTCPMCSSEETNVIAGQEIELVSIEGE